jgi:hypothetical protein
MIRSFELAYLPRKSDPIKKEPEARTHALN